MFNAKLLGLVSLVALTFAVGCSAPAPSASTTSSASSAPGKNIQALHAPASAETTKVLGIAVWHVLVEPDANAIVLDGMDANGVVKFSTSIRNDGKGLTLEGFKGVTGVISLRKLSNGTYEAKQTLDIKKWSRFANAMKKDWARGDVEEGYSWLGDVLRKSGDVVRSAGDIAQDLYDGAKAVVNRDFREAGNKLGSALEKAGNLADGNRSDGKPLGTGGDVSGSPNAGKDEKSEGSGGDALENASKDTELDEETKDQETKDQETKDEEQDAQQDQEIENEEQDAQQDQEIENEEQDAQQDQEIENEEQDAQQDQEIADQEQDAQQDQEIAEEAFSAHKSCRKASCSASTKVCICKRY